jgi:heparinase II/III-like protein
MMADPVAAGGTHDPYLGSTPRLRWYLRRARTMEIAEIPYRLQQAARVGADFIGFLMRSPKYGRLAPDAEVISRFCCATVPQLPELPWHEPSLAETAAALRGECPGAGGGAGGWCWRPSADIWRVAPDTGRHWPHRFYGLIDHRPGNETGDVRVAWEPSRLQHLVVLALIAGHQQNDDGHASAAASMLKRQLLSWVENNPPLRGVHYLSAMQCALRILSVCVAADLARKHFHGNWEFWGAVVRLVDSHARFISGRLSLHSSRGNHTLAECTGLIFAALLFPELPNALAWERTATAYLSPLADEQILQDGGSVEQAFCYHRQIVDFVGLAAALLKHHRRDSGALEAAHQRGIRFLASFGEAGDGMLRAGDSDDGFALSRFLALPRPFRCDRDVNGAPSTASGVRLLTFPDTGLSLIRADAQGILMSFDHGPLGLPANYAHGHADALSVTMRVGTVDVLVDPGTYKYGGEGPWRRYFRGTSAHNTVIVDESDQASQQSSFLWSDPYTAELRWRQHSDDGRVMLVGRHDGYRHRFGILHWRAVRYWPEEGLCIVGDALEGGGEHDFRLRWHFKEPVAQGSECLVSVGAPGAPPVARLRCTGGKASLLSACTAPLAGWFSPRYGERIPSQTLEVWHRGTAPHMFQTVIVLGAAAADASAFDHLRDMIRQEEKEFAAVLRRIR